ncbi:ornithine cyclodeaminase family protein [Phenylobacterium sp.]|uniref:ornithine cyclodeaminase family protein n=1 Tax=Phenylobacterium sp. TaxID=1871053 RepID=UPI00301DEF82
MVASIAGLSVFDAAAVRERLTYGAAIPRVREAMIALSDGRARQLLRSFIGLGEGRTFAIMPAALSEREAFGAKLVSVFHDGQGRKAHEGLVVLFDGGSGAPVALADAGEVTAIRTAAASAVATDALARKDARVLAIVGTGRQAEAHIAALRQVRDFDEVRVWGRDPARTAAFAQAHGLAHDPAAGDLPGVLAGADVVCTVTASVDPVVRGEWISPGAHVNVVGSSGPGQAEIDAALVARARFLVDHREHVLAHGGEFLRAKAAGLVGDDHIAGEIGEVLTGKIAGRASDSDVTIYKSLGHAVQDLAVVAWLHERTLECA